MGRERQRRNEACGTLNPIFTLVFPLVGFFILYWVIRLAVRHGMQDVERQRQTP